MFDFLVCFFMVFVLYAKKEMTVNIKSMAYSESVILFYTETADLVIFKDSWAELTRATPVSVTQVLKRRGECW